MASPEGPQVLPWLLIWKHQTCCQRGCGQRILKSSPLYSIFMQWLEGQVHLYPFRFNLIPSVFAFSPLPNNVPFGEQDMMCFESFVFSILCMSKRGAFFMGFELHCLLLCWIFHRSSSISNSLFFFSFEESKFILCHLFQDQHISAVKNTFHRKRPIFRFPTRFM